MLHLFVVASYILIIFVVHISAAKTGISNESMENIIAGKKLISFETKNLTSCLKTIKEEFSLDAEAILSGVIYILRQTVSQNRKSVHFSAECDLNTTTALEVYLTKLELNNTQLKSLMEPSMFMLNCSKSLLPQDPDITDGIECFIRLLAKKMKELEIKSTSLQRQAAVKNSVRAVSDSKDTDSSLSKNNQIRLDLKKDIKETDLNAFHEHPFTDEVKMRRVIQGDITRLLCDLIKFNNSQETNNSNNKHQGGKVLQRLSLKFCDFPNEKHLKLHLQEEEDSTSEINRAFYSDVLKELASSKIWSKILGKSITRKEISNFFHEWSFELAVLFGRSKPDDFAQKIVDIFKNPFKIKPILFYVRIFTNTLGTYLQKHGLLKLNNIEEFAHDFFKALKKASIYIPQNGPPVSYIKALTTATHSFLIDKLFLNLQYKDSFISYFWNELKEESTSPNTSISLFLYNLAPEMFSVRVLSSTNATARVTALAKEIATEINSNSTNKFNIDLKALVNRIRSIVLEICIDNHEFKANGVFIEALLEILSALLTVLKNSVVKNYTDTNMDLVELIKNQILM